MRGGGIRSLLKFSGFASLWSGQLVSRFGDAISSIALIWLALELSGSALIVSSLMICNMIPSILFTIPAGAFVDRHSRKRIMVFSSVGRSLLLLVLFFLSVSGAIEIWHMCVLTFIDSTVECFFGPALGATLPNIVDEEHLLSANSAMSITISVSQMVGMGAGGAIIGFISIHAAFFIGFLTYVAAAVSVAIICFKEKAERTERGGGLKDIKEGFSFVAKMKVLMVAFMIAVILNFGAGALNIIIPVLSENMGLEVEGYGYMIASFGAGSLLGAVVLSEMGNKGVVHTKTILILEPLIWAMCFLCAPFFKTLLSYVTIFCIIGVISTFGNAATSTILQSSTPDEMRGRVLSIEHLIVLAMMPFSAAAAGPLIEFYGTGFTFYCVAAISFVAFLIALIGLRKRDRNEI